MMCNWAWEWAKGQTQLEQVKLSKSYLFYRKQSQYTNPSSIYSILHHRESQVFRATTSTTHGTKWKKKNLLKLVYIAYIVGKLTFLPCNFLWTLDSAVSFLLFNLNLSKLNTLLFRFLIFLFVFCFDLSHIMWIMCISFRTMWAIHRHYDFVLYLNARNIWAGT